MTLLFYSLSRRYDTYINPSADIVHTVIQSILDVKLAAMDMFPLFGDVFKSPLV